MRHKTFKVYFFYTETLAVQIHDNFVVVYTTKTDHVIKLSGFQWMTKIRNIYGNPLRYSEYYFIFLELDRYRAKDILFFPRPLHRSSDPIYNEGNDLSDFTQTCSPSTMKV